MSASDPVDEWVPRWSSFDAFLADDAAQRPDAAFLTELNRAEGSRREWTRAAWRAYIDSVAGGLHELGVRSGDAVAVLAGNDADALAVAFACWRYGWVFVPLNAHDAAGRQAMILKHAGARLLLFAGAQAAQAEQVAQSVGVPAILVSELLQQGTGAPQPAASWEGPALRVYTSGTTGEPKGVELTVANLVVDCDALATTSRWSTESRVLVVLPIHHVNGLVVSCLQSWYVGGTVVLCDRFRSESFWEDVVAERASSASLVPTLLEFLLEQDGTPAAPPHFTEVFCGAGPLRTETVVAFERRFKVPVRHLYGLSETTAVATMMPVLSDADRRALYVDHGFPSIGRAVSHVEVAIHDPAGRPCPAGERGEIVIRGATVMSGYAGRPEVTSQVLYEGWFHSGDEGFWVSGADGEPYFYVTGRMKELIIRGGVNISPFVVDEVINAHPAVRFGLAIAFENKYYGEEIAAYVVRAEPITEAELLQFCSARLDFGLCPKVVLFGDDVPYTTTGKAKRLSLKERLAAELGAFRDVQFRRRADDESGRNDVRASEPPQDDVSDHRP